MESERRRKSILCQVVCGVGGGEHNNKISALGKEMCPEAQEVSRLRYAPVYIGEPDTENNESLSGRKIHGKKNMKI